MPNNFDLCSQPNAFELITQTHTHTVTFIGEFSIYNICMFIISQVEFEFICELHLT